MTEADPVTGGAVRGAVGSSPEGRIDVVPIGRTGVSVSALGLGTAPLGGLYTSVADEAAEATAREALDAGMSYVDTAPHYGLGIAERRLGAVLGKRPRDSYVLSTKVGRLLRPRPPGRGPEPGEMFPDTPPLSRVWDWSRDGIRRSLAGSLDRLGLDRVDIVYLHDPDDHEGEVYATAYPALAELRAEGVVAAIGAGMNQAEMLTRFVHRLDLDVVIVAGRYTLLDQGAAAELLPACADRGIAVVVGGVYNSGLLADPRPDATFDYVEAPGHLVERAQRLAEACARHHVPLRAAALRFPYAHPAVTSVLIGVRSPNEVADNVRAYHRPIPTELWSDLVADGLLPTDVPVPNPNGQARDLTSAAWFAVDPGGVTAGHAAADSAEVPSVEILPSWVARLWSGNRAENLGLCGSDSPPSFCS